MNTPGTPPSPMGGSSPFGGNNNNWQQMLAQFLQQNPNLLQQQQMYSPPGPDGISTFAPIPKPDLPQQQPMTQSGMGGPQQQWFVPNTANGIWAKPGMTTPGMWGAGPAGSGATGPGVA